MTEQQDPAGARSTFLPILLTGMAGLFFLLVLILITGGLFFYVAFFGAMIAGLATFHWLVWGKLLTILTARERKEEELHEQTRQEAGRTHSHYRR